jgi:opacity protein-like surface antigen
MAGGVGRLLRAALVVVLLLGGWFHALQAVGADGRPYVRFEAGMSQPEKARFRDNDPNSPNCFLIAASTTGNRCDGTLNHLGTGWTLGAGLGYQFTDRFRVDVSYNHRAGYKLKGTDPAGTDFDPDVKSRASMVNGTYNLPMVMGSIKPFIGGGIGRSRNEMKPLNWNDPGCCSGTLTGGSKTDRAWQFTFGGEILLDKGEKTLEFLYRHMDMGRFVKNLGPDQAAPAGSFNASGITGPGTGRLRSNEFLFAIRRNF